MDLLYKNCKKLILRWFIQWVNILDTQWNSTHFIKAPSFSFTLWSCSFFFGYRHTCKSCLRFLKLHLVPDLIFLVSWFTIACIYLGAGDCTPKVKQVDLKMHRDQLIGSAFIAFGIILFVGFFYAAVLTKMLPPYENRFLSAIQNDR